MREDRNPKMSWSFPIVTGHKYRMHWQEANDFENMFIELSPLWNLNDKNVHMMTNFTRDREVIKVTDMEGTEIANKTYLQPEATLVHGDNVLYPTTDKRIFNWVINGKDMKKRQAL